MSYDGEMQYDDKGIRVYWDAEEEEWIEAPEYATERFIKLLDSLDTFEGFDDNANDDSDDEDSDDDDDDDDDDSDDDDTDNEFKRVRPRCNFTIYTAILELDKSRLIENIMNILNKTDDINDVHLLEYDDTLDKCYQAKIGFISSLNRIQAVEKLVFTLNCFVNKLYNIHNDGKEYEWE